MNNVSVNIYYGRVESLSKYSNLLSYDEIHRAKTYSSLKRQNEFIAGRALLRLSLAFESGIPPSSFEFDIHDGKPSLCGSSSNSFSLSHSDDWVGCALSSNQICGFDIQVDDKRKSREGIAEGFFSSSEAEWLRCQSDYSSSFYCLWTLKEAWAKAFGISIWNTMAGVSFQEGLNGCERNDMQACTVPLDDNATMAWVVGGMGAEVRGWRWGGTGFSPFKLSAKSWCPRYHSPPSN